MASTPRLEEWMRLSKERLTSTSIMRKYIDVLYIRPRSFSPPEDLGPGVKIERVDIDEWPLYRISTSPATAGPALLYCHGGDFVNEIVSQHYKLAAQIARDTGLVVEIPIYPLVPRRTASFEWVVEGLCDLLTQSNIVSIAGDSVGGTLAILTMQHLIRKQPLVASRVKSLILISPLLDCTLNHPQTRELEAMDPWLGVDGLRLASEEFSGGLELSDPRASPLFGNIADLPATLLLSGTRDLLCADARRLSARFLNGGMSENAEECIAGSVELEGFKYIEGEDMLHVWPLVNSPEGAEVRDVIMEFLKKHIEYD
ncbi:Alpha/Beta hydrolase protein [Fusarium flagelliforme]|uniref:Alpha/Beta hydrolase protein n=1 Tax=Fusarium flagelliforme TaxID=2675880 RepID=UPI001E8E2623|nr:Alpha/Beta hydrolase protein [Fusarium flagelliforme]KAH7191839.1 Alpha/Beta hydrolase protein [Fusarium flagelliforme]